ncbi:hypothetical protein DM298_04225 [Lactobacillus amylovorus]|uniref:Uncharacterized protein n=1 Tax=Lactobacillus amylovorus TaxID=1604 RepID=A0A5B8EFI0_LACAM|nr:hypothetical protein [Lactobacillus amylovorus]QDD70170.1 hypothetical protein DM298_04225 [Lactobacillus amylovorus]
MAEFTDAHSALEFLETLNNKNCTIVAATENGKKRPATIKDLQEMNYETIINLCDLLGMSDIYMGGKKK